MERLLHDALEIRSLQIEKVSSHTVCNIEIIFDVFRRAKNFMCFIIPLRIRTALRRCVGEN